MTTDKRAAQHRVWYEAHKAERLIYHKAYRDSHREKIMADQKAYRDSHKNEIAIYQKSYRESHLDKVTARAKAYVESHKKERSAYHEIYYKKNRDKILAKHKQTYPIWREAHKHERRAYHLKLNHGLTLEAFNNLLSAQGGVCAICQGMKWGRQGPNIDHDHESGKIRGILCHGCNVSLGLIHDNKQTALSMADYLQKFEGQI